MNPDLRPPKSLTPITSIAELKKAVEMIQIDHRAANRIYRKEGDKYFSGYSSGFVLCAKNICELISEFAASVKGDLKFYEDSPIRPLVTARALRRILGEGVKG